jgi:hypothetical protein
MTSTFLRSISIGLGMTLAGGAAIVSPLLGACSCGPDPPPRTRDCASPLTDFTGVTSVSIVSARAVNGFQGGQHFQFQIQASGTGLGNCIAESATLLEGGSVLASTTSPVEAGDDGAGGIVTSPIILFPPTGPGRVATLRVETLGRTLEQVVSLDPFGAPIDAAVVPDTPDAFVPVDADLDAAVPTYTVELALTDDAGVPMEGVSLEARLTTGRVLTATSDAAGRLSTASFEWPADATLDVTLTGAGVVPTTIAGVTPESLSRLGTLALSRPRETVTISGTLTFLDALHRAALGTDARASGRWNEAGSTTSYSLPVARGAPFHVFGFEHTSASTGRDRSGEVFGSVVHEGAALDADATIDLAFVAPTSVETALGSIALPTGADLSITVENLDTHGDGQGLLTDLTYAPDGASATYEVAFLRHDANVRPATTFRASLGGIERVMRLDDYPSSGEQPALWLDPPSTTHDSGTLFLGEPLGVDGFLETLRITFSDAETRWVVIVLRPSDVLLTPPSGADAWAWPLRASVESCETLAGNLGDLCRRSATSPGFTFNR